MRSDDRTALERGDDLDGPEAEADEIAERPKEATLGTRAEGVRRVLDHTEAVLSRQFVNLVDPARHARVVDRHDRLRALADERADRVGVEAERLLLDVAQADARACRRDRLVACDIREGGDDDLVARAEPREGAGAVEGRGATREGEEVAVVRREAEVRRQLLLEPVGEAADGEPAPVERALGRVVDLGADVRLENLDRGLGGFHHVRIIVAARLVAAACDQAPRADVSGARGTADALRRRFVE